jgi:hypothetical protein
MTKALERGTEGNSMGEGVEGTKGEKEPFAAFLAVDSNYRTFFA